VYRSHGGLLGNLFTMRNRRTILRPLVNLKPALDELGPNRSIGITPAISKIELRRSHL
jgi:hypothetical protein